ncbi:carbohydrate ABC transporter permease [Vulcanococcus limneticus Candia 3F8]|uniref:carbohydrate ABC transporter permease n=1 Tax=Vulcanococcus limneticus TaxID=2170428 RepID=UPI000B993D51|nr:carbohydrate ABC transporter permease [Vulcanococcus limneticus]MCP9792340.1 carbohydrate ABC transporter permease [Vulcanococcus limneticus MW73D5]MCP9893815.1 carbohydrate ABC transporter permease [Vulcanococcus limneticus Candia 3F8]MCP9897689.1 carbohydrate ABC transporter permease [Vulcanococcus limneticus Candia 3B3]
MRRPPHPLLLLGALLWSLLPLLWQLLTSLRTPEALVAPTPAAWLSGWTLANYRQVLLGQPPFWRYLLNSALVGGASTGLTLALAIPAAYGLQQQGLRLQRLITLLLLAAAKFPYVLLFLALLELARALGWGNQLLALAVPYAGLSLPLAVLLLRAALADLPPDLEDAARLEGLNLGQRLRRVLLPLLAPAIASTAILVFLFSWNEYPIALTWISRAELLTLPTAMARIAGSSVYAVPYGAYAAATVLGSLPLLALVLLFQRQIVSGLTQGSVRG